MRRQRRQSRGSPDVPVSSFSDIAFLLIIFFILAATLTQLTGIKTEVPTGEKSDAPPEKTNIVNLNDNGIVFNDKEVALEELKKQLASLDLPNQADDQKIILLESTGRVSYQVYYQVITAITNAGGAIALVQTVEE